MTVLTSTTDKAAIPATRGGCSPRGPTRGRRQVTCSPCRLDGIRRSGGFLAGVVATPLGDGVPDVPAAMVQDHWIWYTLWLTTLLTW
jgi:hypothetical protein